MHTQNANQVCHVLLTSVLYYMFSSFLFFLFIKILILMSFWFYLQMDVILPSTQGIFFPFPIDF